MSLLDLIFGSRNKTQVDANAGTDEVVLSSSRKVLPKDYVDILREEHDAGKWAFIDTEV